MDYPLKTAEQLRQQLRSLRKKRGLTQARLGLLIGVTQARVVEIEANPGSVGLQQARKILVGSTTSAAKAWAMHVVPVCMTAIGCCSIRCW